MMPVVRISDAALADLKAISIWLEAKTPSETVEKVIHEMMDNLGLERGSENEEHVKTKGGKLIFERAPGLSFTRVRRASVDGMVVSPQNWAQMLVAMIGAVRKKCRDLSTEAFVNELQIPARSDKYEKEGYKFYAFLGISIQGQAAPEAWKEINRLARKWIIPVSVEFQWRENEKAQYPGKIGVLQVGREQFLSNS